MRGYERKVVRLLKAHGFSVKRNPRGNHVIWSNGDRIVSVPAKTLKRHTANAILKKAGIQEKV